MNYGKFNVLFQFDFLVRILVENLIAKDNLKGEKVPNKTAAKYFNFSQRKALLM